MFISLLNAWNSINSQLYAEIWNKANWNIETESETDKWESQAKIDNVVHPLHSATSLGPSPMGIDPINGFKMVQIVLDSANQFQQLQNRMLDKVCETISLENYKLAFKRQRKAK